MIEKATAYVELNHLQTILTYNDQETILSFLMIPKIELVTLQTYYKSFSLLLSNTFAHIIDFTILPRSIAIRSIYSIVLITGIFYASFIIVDRLVVSRYSLIDLLDPISDIEYIINQAPLKQQQTSQDFTTEEFESDLSDSSDFEGRSFEKYEINSNTLQGSPKFKGNHHFKLSPSPEPRTNFVDSQIYNNPNIYNNHQNNSSKPLLKYLDRESLYKNLNNSSQYLRRDSFSQ